MTALRSRSGANIGSAQRLIRCAVAALLVSAGLITADCGGDYPPLVPPSADQTLDVNPRNPAELLDGGTLRLPISDMPHVFNPLNVDAPFDYLELAKASYPRAYRILPDGSLAVNTDYFTDVALTSTDPFVVTYTINSKAVWSDGSPITWEDIRYQVKAMDGTDKRFATYITSGFDRVATVTAGSDDRQAIVTFNRPYAEWQGMFAGNSMLLPRSMTATPDAFNEKAAGPGPSAGPFLISGIDETNKRITLTRNPKWWGTPPRLGSIVYVVLDPVEQPHALEDKTIDAAEITTEYNLADIRRDDGIAIRRASKPCWRVITFNGAPGAILADKKLRLAISTAIDREAIVNVYLRGLLDNPRPMNTHLVMPYQPSSGDNVASAVVFSPDEAREELDELGWKLKGDVREKEGKQLIIRDVYWFDETNWQVAQMLKKQLANVGVKLVIDDAPKNDFLTDGSFDLTQSTNCTDVFPLGSMEQTYRTNGESNYGKIGNQDIDTQISQALTETDPNASHARAYEADALLWDEVPSLPLGRSAGVAAVRTNVANYGAFGVADVDYTAVGFTQ